MIITTTPTIDGHIIKEYLGPVAGADTYLPGGLIGEGFWSKQQSSLITNAYSKAISFMKESAPRYTDAIVNVSMVITTTTAGSVIVAATGTAVKLERIPTAEEIEAKRIQEQKKKEEALKLEAERKALVDEFSSGRGDQRIVKFFSACKQYNRFRFVLDEWEKQGLSGVAVYSELEKDIRNMTERERLYGPGYDPDKVHKYLVQKAAPFGLYRLFQE